MTQRIEITEAAFLTLRGNDEKSWHDYQKHETHEITEYRAHGVRLFALCNFASCCTQYFIEDINA